MASVARYKFVPSMIQEQDDVFYQVLDEDSVLNGLTNETSPTKRTAILEGLRNSVRHSGGRLHIQERFSLFSAIHNVLLDNDVNTRLACLNFICEVIPDFGNDLDDCMTLILPQLVVFVGHNQVSLKKLAVQTLHVYMKHSEHLENVLNAIIQLGLESENVDTQMESLIALPILITPNFADEDLFLLTEALVRRIAGNSSSSADSSATDTTSLAMISLERIRSVVGKRNFEEYIQRLSPILQNVLAKAMKGGISNERKKSRKAKSATGVPLEENQPQHATLDKGKLDRCFTTVGGGCESMINGNSDEGYVPSRIMKKLKNSDWRLKEQGVEELRIWFEKDMEPGQLSPHLKHFVGVVKELLNDSNFKVNLTSLQLVGTMAEKLGSGTKPFLESLVNALTSKLGDNKNVMKQTNMQVFMKLMQNLSPKTVLKMLKVNLQHRNSRVREETLNIIIASLLTFPSTEFDLSELTSDVAPALIDPKRRVRHAALESFAVISQAMGPGNLQPLVSTVDNVELRMGGDGIMAAVQARFARRQLPKLNSDGLVEYAVHLPSSGSAKGNVNMVPCGADVEWILAGGSSSDCPSSARSTPGISDSGMGVNPRRHLSAGKNRLPWENGEKTDGVTENNPSKIKNSWGMEVKQESKVKNVKDGFTIESRSSASHSSYAVKYNTQKSLINNANQSEPSNQVTTYAQLHKSKSAKSQPASLLSGKSIKGAGLGPIVNGANGYSLIYKKGSLHGRSTHEFSKGVDTNNNSSKQVVRDGSLGAKSLSPFGSRLAKTSVEKSKQGILGMKNTNLSASLPDWSELSSRPRKLLSPVSPSSNHDEDCPSLSNEASGYVESPIQTKPILVRSASKKGRMLKSIDFSDIGSSPRVPDASSPTQLSQIPPRDPLSETHRHTGKHLGGRNLSPLSSDTEDSPGRHQRQAVGNRTWSAGSTRKFDDDSVPFDKKPRIARTPVHLKRRSSTDAASDVPSTANSLRHTRDSNGNSARDAHVPTRKVSQTNSDSKQTDKNYFEDDTKRKKDMEVVGHAFDTAENRQNRTMHSTLDSTSGIGSSLEESGEIGNVKIGGREILMNDQFSSDEREDSTRVEDVDDYEFEYEEDTESGDEVARNPENMENDVDAQVKDARLLKEYQEHVDKLDQADIYSESMYDDSEGESLRDSDEDDVVEDRFGGGYPHRSLSPDEGNGSRDLRQSLSKSTRERMERKRLEEEERIMRERQRIEELERQNQLRLESKEQSFRDKLAKEQREIENLIKRKEKERELEKLKQEKLQKQLEQREDALREDFRRSRSYLEELDKAKEVQRQKERAEKLKKLQQKRDRELNELGPRGNVVNEMDGRNEELTVQGHHTPSRVLGVINKGPLGGSLRKKTTAVIPNSQPPQDTSSRMIEPPSSSTRSHLISASSNASVPAREDAESELKPFSDGEAAVKTTLKLLADKDWESKCDGLLSVRRLIRHHVEDVIPQLHCVTLAVVTEVKNLRSQVSRAAIYTLGDMYTCLEKHMDLDLELTTNVLLKKAGEASSFIRGDVERSLGCLVSSVTSSKAISALVSGGSSHRNVNVRKTAAQFLCMLAERMGPARCLSGSRDITERILKAAAAFASDGGAETRYYGRRILHMLDNHDDFERMLNKYLPSKSLNPTITIIENLRTKGLGDIPSDTSSARARKLPSTSGVGSRSSSILSSGDAHGPSSIVSSVPSPISTTSRESSRRHSRRVSHETVSPQDQEDVTNLVQQLSSNDWKERMQAIDKLVEMTDTRLPLVNSNLVKILDGFTPRLLDNNSKVNLHALQSLLTIIPTLKENLNSSSTSIVPAVAKNLASKNSSITSISEDVLDSLVKHVDNARLLQPLCHFISMAPGGVRSRPSAVKKLLAIVTDVYPRKPSSVSKHVLPVLWTLLESSSSTSVASGNMKDAVYSLSRLLYSLMGESLSEQAAGKSKQINQKLTEILNS